MISCPEQEFEPCGGAAGKQPVTHRWVGHICEGNSQEGERLWTGETKDSVVGKMDLASHSGGLSESGSGHWLKRHSLGVLD